MTVALLANLGSGAGGAERVADLLRDGGAGVETLDFRAACDAEADVVERVRRADRLVAAGGDGSLGPAAALALAADVPLAIVPTGTANSLARFLEIPLDVEEAVALALDPDARTRPLEVAHADGRPFLNAATAGLAVLAAHRARPLKKPLGPFAYAAGALRAGITGRPLATSVRCDGRLAWRGRAWQVIVAGTGAFGGDSGTGGVDPADERLDVAIVEAGARRKLVRRAWAMRKQRLMRDDGVLGLRCAEIEIDLPRGSEVNVDGEILTLERARFGVLGRTEVVVAG